MAGIFMHLHLAGLQRVIFKSPLACFIQMIVKIMNILGNAWPFFQNMNLKVKEAGRPLLPTYLKGPRTFDLLLNIGFYDGVCLIACQPRPITYFEPKFSTLARKLHQTEINTYINSYILHLLLSFLLKCCCFLNSLPDPIRSQITGNAAVPTCLASVTLALCSILALWLHQ